MKNSLLAIFGEICPPCTIVQVENTTVTHTNTSYSGQTKNQGHTYTTLNCYSNFIEYMACACMYMYMHTSLTKKS